MNNINRVLKSIVHNKSANIFYRSMCAKALTNVKFSHGVKEITMVDVTTRNSLSMNMQKELIQHITSDWDNKDLRVIVLKAEGHVFSSGHNLKEFNLDALPKSLTEEVFKLANELMFSIIECPVPVIACVNGVAAAAGCQLAAQCDIVIASEKSYFSTPGVNFGVFCSTPGIPLVRTVPRKIASYMLITGIPLTATQAHTHGLVSLVCKEEELKGEVHKMCKTIIAKSRSIITRGKKFFYEQVEMDMKKAYEAGAQEMCAGIGSPDGQEGLKSFMEKRKPNWSHTN